MRPTTPETFWAQVERGAPEECWPWTGARKHRGYGQVSLQGRNITAHRLAWQLTNGPIPDGLFVCHHCDNPPCCNPAHLFLGTPKDNQVDCKAKGRKNFPLGERHGHAKLTADLVRAIRARHATGEKQNALAREFGVSLMTLNQVVHRRTWSHV